jgi:hypothetical protein
MSQMQYRWYCDVFAVRSYKSDPKVSADEFEEEVCVKIQMVSISSVEGHAAAGVQAPKAKRIL